MRFIFCVAVSISCFLPQLALGCTVCDSETGAAVRVGIFGNDFWGTLAAVASPFPVLLLAIALLHRRIPSSIQPNESQSSRR